MTTRTQLISFDNEGQQKDRRAWPCNWYDNLQTSVQSYEILFVRQSNMNELSVCIHVLEFHYVAFMIILHVS